MSRPFGSLIFLILSTSLAGGGLPGQTIDDVRDEVREILRQEDYVRRVVALVDFSTEPTLSGARYEVDGEPTTIDILKLPWRRDLLDADDDVGLRLEAGVGWLRVDPGNLELFDASTPDLQTNVDSCIEAFSGTTSAGPIFRLSEEWNLVTVGRVAYAYLDSDASYSGPGAQLSQSIFDRLLFNWSVHTLSYGFGVELDHTTPLTEEITLQSRLRFDATWTETIKETDNAQKASVETQRGAIRADLVGPTGWRAFDAPLDYRVHGGYALFDNRTGTALGFQDVFEVGGGLEARAAAWDLGPLSRVSLGVSLLFGDDVWGYTFGGSIGF